MAIWNPPLGVTSTFVRGRRHSDGCTALDPSIETIFRTCSPFARRTAIADDAGSFISGLKPVLMHRRDVQKNVGAAIVRHDEAKSFDDVEPFDSPGNFDKVERFDG